VEIARFSDAESPRDDAIVYVGSVGTWYLLDEMLSFFAAYRRLRPSARFVIANRGQQQLIERALSAFDQRDAVTVRAVPFEEIPRLLMGCAAGIVLLSEGGSKLASSPIKVAEYLAAGLPVVANEIVGDTPALLRSTRAGIVIDRVDGASLEAGARALRDLLAEGPSVRERARALARSAFDSRQGARRYGDLYDRLLAPRSAP
jgi:glycosyltransferase involved in cell wall biosynthesis